MQQISPQALVDMNAHACAYLQVDIVYAQPHHPENIFGAVYRPDARLWLHEDLARIVLRAAHLCHEEHGHAFILKDGLRTIEAQAKMARSPIALANPHWMVDGPSRLLSPPGAGGHPRGMAVDVVLKDTDMGTVFDHLSEDPHNNPAARSYKDFPAPVLTNRAVLEKAMTDAARDLTLPLVPLASE